MISAAQFNTVSGSHTLPSARFHLCFDQPDSPASITHLRKTSRCYAECIGLGRADADDLEILLGELSSNVIRHAGSGTYHVSIEFLNDRYIVSVVDEGIGFDPDAIGESCTLRPDTLSATGEERIGGLGLVMVRAIADQVSIVPTVPQGTTIRAEKMLPASVTVRADLQ